MFAKQSLIKSWAIAISDIALETNNVEQFLKTSSDLSHIFLDNQDLNDLLSNKFVPLETRNKVLENIFSKEIDITLLNTLKLIVERDLISATPYIFREVEKKLLQETNTVKGIVYSINKLDKSLIDLFEQKFTKKLNKKVMLVNEIKTDLIAGIRVQVDGKKYDSSIQGKAHDMKRKIKQYRK
ncbi:F0F1 ATP synthase subunit delta [Spiroplasma culicicola]|uniref:ATP synthase subunit delta n=1 Tax=Spiroplasma culicicola AES-1 TaxID=1276246 RepID=W6AFD2_9MOLU|nr:F0F1 ATP synthase subunit delta [Spiroplasma culicicola]AHI52399.1 F0F1 ATP synthase subunit delta [Spiroplasma culicicola AES-1]